MLRGLLHACETWLTCWWIWRQLALSPHTSVFWNAVGNGACMRSEYPTFPVETMLMLSASQMRPCC